MYKRWDEVIRNVVRDDRDDKMGRVIPDVRWFWREMSLTHSKEVSERTAGIQPQNSPCV